MTANGEYENRKADTPALPGVPAIRYEWQKAALFQPEMETDDADLNDISAIINGNKAITGKAVYSANQAGRNADQIETQKADQKKREAEIQETRELMHLTEWNGQMTNLGGVEMTNEQAQKARQHIIDNEDYYAHRAVKDGRIRATEEEEYKYNNRRIKELKEREGRGIATEEEKRECERRQRSGVGQASEHDAGEYATQAFNQKQNAAVKAKNADSAISVSSLDAKDNPFQSAPDLTQMFANASTSTNDPLPTLNNETPSLAVRDLKSTGLAI